MGRQKVINRINSKRKVCSTNKLYWRSHDLYLDGKQSSVDTKNRHICFIINYKMTNFRD